MRLLGIVLAALVMNVVAASQASKSSEKRQVWIAPAASQHNEDVVLGSLRPVLKPSGYAGRLYYAGRCSAVDGKVASDFVYFPATEVHQPAGSGVEAIESIFRGNGGVKVSKESDHVVSIRIGQPSTTLLQTRVPSLRLAPLGQYNPNLVIWDLQNAPEVKAEMSRLRLSVPLSLYDMGLAQPAEGLPHMPSIMRNMTADQILDSVAITFQGMVVYGICTEPSGRKMYSVYFTGLELK